MATAADREIAARYEELALHFAKWEKIKDLIDQLIDLMLNYRQSGHPGGSRSKVHALVVTLLSGVMRWDIRHPEKRFGDRFILIAGHTIPLIYATLTVLNEALRIKYQQTGEDKYLTPNPEERALYWEDLLEFRHNKGLSGHAEMEGKTLFLKFNTGPSGHGSPPAAGEAFALKRSRSLPSRATLASPPAVRTKPRTRPGAWPWTTSTTWWTGTTLALTTTP
jgi:transketolase